MIVVHYGKDELKAESGSSLTLGTFDGVHLGHRDLLNELLKGEMPTVVTFEPHPQHVLKRHPDPLQLLTPTPEKLRKLERIGIQRTVILPFTPVLAALSADQFLSKLLFEEIGMNRLVVGFNHSFGHNREGNIDYMRKRTEDLGYELVVVDAHTTHESQPVSSTLIRHALREGNLRTANRWLTAPYRMEAEVIHGEGRGRDMGFPTANLAPKFADQLIPAEGVYAIRARMNGEFLPGVASIGHKETFGEHPLAIEVHVFGIDENLYDRSLTVEWIDYLRPQEAFENTEKLVEQMKIDSSHARASLAKTDETGLLPVEKKNED